MYGLILPCFILAFLGSISSVIAADEKPPYIVEGLYIEMPFDEARKQLESTGYKLIAPVVDNRKGTTVRYGKQIRIKSTLKRSSVTLVERRLDMDDKLAKIQAKLHNPAGESGIEPEHRRLVDYFGEDALDCKPRGNKLFCNLTLRSGPFETTMRTTFGQHWIQYTIERKYLENVDDPFAPPKKGPVGPAPPVPAPPVTDPPTDPPSDPPTTPPLVPGQGGAPAPDEPPVPEEPKPGEPPVPEDPKPGEPPAPSDPPAEEGLTAQEQFELAQRYESGDGVSQSHSKAAELYEMAAEKNHAEAQFALGLKYQKGEGVPKDLEKAAELFRQAAENGLAEAQFALGLMYEKGEGVPKDLEKAAELFRLAAESGLAEAQYNLAVKLETGEGVGQNQAEAIDNFRKAAEQGEGNAQLVLGKHYLTGTGVEQSDSQAFEWVKKAAEQGNTKAQFLLGGLYESGIGTAQDIDQAIHWYEEANRKEFKPAQRKLYALGINPYPILQNEEGRERNAASIPYD